MLVAVIDINIVATTGADLNHLVKNILKSEFIKFYMITDEPNYLKLLFQQLDSIELNLLKR